MGFLGRKKHNDAHVSVLSEEEIQKKLYGEFKKDSVRVVGGSDRENLPGTSSVVPRPASRETAPELFEEPQVTEKEGHPDFPSTGHEPESFSEAEAKPAEPKYQSSPATPVSDPYQRYRELNKSKVRSEGMVHKVLGKTTGFFRGLFASNRFFTRQILYWTGGVLVVFLLFWGVNALNVQRERGMQSNYQTTDKTSLAASKSAAKASTPAQKKVTSSNAPLSKSKTPAVAAPVTPIKKKQLVSSAATISYVIQVVTYPSADYAERVVTSLNEAGFNAFSKEDIRSTGTVFYIVMIGGFPTSIEAQQQLAKFRTDEVSRPFSDAFVKRTEL